MSRFAKVLASLALALVAGVLASCSPSGGNAPLTADEQKIGEVVRRYLIANPQVLDEVRAAQVRTQVETDTRDFSIGPANAPVTIVEFMDYRCTFCHRAMDWVLAAQKQHGDKVRVVFVDFPVLGDPSVEAAQAALAAMRQGKYMELHQAMMRHQGPLAGATIDTLARQVGVDVARMRKDMEDEAILDHLRDNHERAEGVGFSATPSFTINGVPVKGYNGPRLESLLAEQLKAAGA